MLWARSQQKSQGIAMIELFEGAITLRQDFAPVTHEIVRNPQLFVIERRRVLRPFEASVMRNSRIEASQYVDILERRQGLKICCPEEIAYRKGFITRDGLLENATRYGKSGYGDYLKRVAAEKE
jgi:hypothetical protein